MRLCVCVVLAYIFKRIAELVRSVCAWGECGKASKRGTGISSGASADSSGGDIASIKNCPVLKTDSGFLVRYVVELLIL